MHVPGVHDNDNTLLAAVPVQLWGPPSVILPSALTAPVKPSKGGANDSEQFVCMTVAFSPTSDGSQCAATLQVPAKLGHAAPPSAEVFPVESPEPELHAYHAHEKRTASAEFLIMMSPYGAIRPRLERGSIDGAGVRRGRLVAKSSRCRYQLVVGRPWPLGKPPPVCLRALSPP